MLVVLNGSPTKDMHQMHIAMQISNVLNNFNQYYIGGYVVDFTKWPYEVYTNKGVLVYKNSTIENEKGVTTLIEELNGKYIVDSIDQFLTKQILDANKYNHYYNDYVDIFNDYGITTTDGFERSIDDVVHMYNSKSVKHQVISGVFSKNFIDKIRKILGVNNVYVLNIMRNPSVSYVLDDTEQQVAELNNTDITIGEVVYSNALTNNILQTLNYVNTMKYEDIIRNGNITINDILIDLPMLVKYNQYITEDEKSQLDNDKSIRKEQLAKFNEVFQNLNSFNDYVTLPNNLFSALGYEPLSYSDIVTKSEV